MILEHCFDFFFEVHDGLKRGKLDKFRVHFAKSDWYITVVSKQPADVCFQS